MRKLIILVCATLLFIFLGINCSGPDSDQPVLTAELPLHLEEHISDAKIVGSEVPQDLPAPVVWDFDEPQPDWKPVKPKEPQWEAVSPVRTDDALRVPLAETDGSRLLGSICVELPDWNIQDWAYVEIRARTSDRMSDVGLAFNYDEEDTYGGAYHYYSIGEWDNTLLIVAADHSIKAAYDDMAAVVQESLPPPWRYAMFRPSVTRIPMIFVWPGHIKGGQRFREPVVSMIDVLPTVLDLVGLPLPEILQGQSLAPLLLGEGTVEDRPVILDEFWIDNVADELRGLIEVVDGRWGASLEINPRPPEENEPEERTMSRRPVPLLLYDLWNDPYCLNSIHEKRPDLVEKYTAFLEAQFEAHQALGQHFTRSKDVVLTPEQLETLRSLGYIR